MTNSNRIRSKFYNNKLRNSSTWTKLPRFSAVCKSWNSAASELNNQLTSFLPHKYPWLLLAEDTGLDISACKVGGDDQTLPDPDLIIKNIPSTRGLFSLKTKKIYYLDLPQATNKVILGTNKGWLLTLGGDLEINLLHPLNRLPFPLPSMLTLPSQEEYHDDYFPQQASTKVITKVALSSQVPIKSALQNQGTCHLPIIMVICERGVLGCARLRDNCWKNVELEAGQRLFHDIVYHKKNFYAIDFRGGVHMCEIDDNDDRKETQSPKGKLITSIPISSIIKFEVI
ncbi:uncharacterized protein LOC141673160 [Apium graveolens]|uniref:uncharacterized protein LOC141673160 n=1 Tax=Apium graveolens TaxID=4045 RepID=UPI003D7B00E4